MVGRVGGLTDRTDRWMDGFVARQTDGPADGWEGRRKNARQYVWTDRQITVLLSWLFPFQSCAACWVYPLIMFQQNI